MLPEVTPRARRPTYDGSDDSDPDVEHGGVVDATEPLLHAGKLSKVGRRPSGVLLQGHPADEVQQYNAASRGAMPLWPS